MCISPIHLTMRASASCKKRSGSADWLNASHMIAVWTELDMVLFYNYLLIYFTVICSFSTWVTLCSLTRVLLLFLVVSVCLLHWLFNVFLPQFCFVSEGCAELRWNRLLATEGTISNSFFPADSIEGCVHRECVVKTDRQTDRERERESNSPFIGLRQGWAMWQKISIIHCHPT